MTETDAAQLGDRFVESGSGAVTSQCLACKRLAGGAAWKCEAFPGGIPDAIVANGDDHRDRIDGDHGLTFDPRDGVPKSYLSRLYDRLDSVG